MSVPDPFAAIRKVMLGQSSITDLLLPQDALSGLTEGAPIFALEYPRQDTRKPRTDYAAHDWAALLHARSIRMLLISPTGRVSSGGDNSRAPYGRVRFDLLSYGRTFADAAAAHWAAYEFLKELGQARAAMSGGTALIYDCTVEGGPISFIDPDVECPVLVGIYAATVAEQYVA